MNPVVLLTGFPLKILTTNTNSLYSWFFLDLSGEIFHYLEIFFQK